MLSLERRLPSRHGPARLVVVDDPVPSAHALAGLPRCGGHILVSTGILQALDDTDLRHAVLAHERAHLRHHHATIRVRRRPGPSDQPPPTSASASRSASSSSAGRTKRLPRSPAAPLRPRRSQPCRWPPSGPSPPRLPRARRPRPCRRPPRSPDRRAGHEPSRGTAGPIGGRVGLRHPPRLPRDRSLLRDDPQLAAAPRLTAGRPADPAARGRWTKPVSVTAAWPVYQQARGGTVMAQLGMRARGSTARRWPRAGP